MASSKKAVVSITNVEPTMLLMKRYGTRFSNMVREDVSTKVSPYVATIIAGRAAGSTKQAQAVAQTFKATRDRLPAVRGFGASRVTKNGAKAGDIGFGANWGGGSQRRTKQFGPWTGGGVQDRFIFSTVHEHDAEIQELWQLSLDRAYVDWNRG